MPPSVGARAQLISDLELTSEPARPRPVTLLPGVDETLAGRYRAEAALILVRMQESSRQHPLLRWLRALIEDLGRALRVALS